MTEQKGTYKSVRINFHEQESIGDSTFILCAELVSHRSGDSRWDFSLFDIKENKHIFQNVSREDVIKALTTPSFLRGGNLVSE